MTNEYQITNKKNPKQKFDLEERTLTFSKNCINISKLLVMQVINIELIRQLIRSSTSVGANYREANEATTKKEFYHRIGICRKEAKESKYWLQLLQHANTDFDIKIGPLINEAHQLTRIFASISKTNNK